MSKYVCFTASFGSTFQSFHMGMLLTQMREFILIAKKKKKKNVDSLLFKIPLLKKEDTSGNICSERGITCGISNLNSSKLTSNF